MSVAVLALAKSGEHAVCFVHRLQNMGIVSADTVHWSAVLVCGDAAWLDFTSNTFIKSPIKL